MSADSASTGGRPAPAGCEWAKLPDQTVPAALLVLKDDRVVDRIDLSSRALTVLGRNSMMSDVALDHPSLSRQHAAVGFDADGNVCVIDLKSSHGSYLNDSRLEPLERRVLAAGDVLKFGGSSRLYQLHFGEWQGAAASAASSSSATAAMRAEDISSDVGLSHRHAAEHAMRAGAAADAGSAAHSGDAARRARDAELAAAIASMRAPVEYSSSSAQSSTEAVRRSAAATTVAAEDEQQDQAEADGDTGAGGGSDGLPVAFGSSSRGQSSRPGGSTAAPPAKRARLDDAGAASGGAGSGAGGGQLEEQDGGEEDDDDDDGEWEGEEAADAGSSGAGGSSSAAAQRMGLPISHEVVLAGHSKSVTAVALDPGGARLVTGSNDYMLRFYDFGGMDRNHRSFREITPADGNPITSVAYNSNGEKLAVGSTSAKLRIITRDAQPVVTTVKGDVYLSDISNTKGHQAAVSSVFWHPQLKDVFYSGSADGSVRVWELGSGRMAFDEMCCNEVIKTKNARGTKTGVTAAGIAPDGKMIVAATDDGSLQMFAVRPSTTAKYHRPDAAVRSAHAAGDTTCVVFSSDGNKFATRGADECVKLWDARKFSDRSAPVGVVRGVGSHHASANVAWSPDGNWLVVGTAVREKGSGDGKLLVLGVSEVEAAASTGGIDGTAAAAYSAAVCPSASAVALLWHPKINQIVVGCGDGATRVLYDPQLSSKGALLSTARAPKRRDMSEVDAFATHGAVLLPNALPMYKEDAGSLWVDKKRKRGAEGGAGSGGAAKAYPEKPVAAPEFLSKARTFTEYFMQHNKAGVNLREQDPQRVLQAYAQRGAAAAAPSDAVYLRAYAATQPTAVLAETTLEAEMDAATKKPAQPTRPAAGGAGGP